MKAIPFFAQERPESCVPACVRMGPLTGVPVIHAVVLDRLDEPANEIHVLDPAVPLYGERIWTFQQFELGWRAARYQTILISSPNL